MEKQKKVNEFTAGRKLLSSVIFYWTMVLEKNRSILKKQIEQFGEKKWITLAIT